MEGGRNTDKPLRVLLADDHVAFRQGLAAFLGAHDGIEVVAWVPNDDEVPELARELRPDVVVMEARVPLEEAGASIDRMREISPPPKVVAATMREDPSVMRAFRRLGASGWVPKSSRMAVLLGAIRAAASSPEGGSTGAEGPGGASWVSLTEDMLAAEDVGEDGADGHA